MTTLMTIMALQYLNVPYRWAGSNYKGLDCSGLVMKVLHDVGVTLPDMTAQNLYDYCTKKGYMSNEKACDSLVFFGKNEKSITHVGISIGEIENKWLMIEAGGAGRNSLEMTSEELAQRDARVRIKEVDSRSDLIASIKFPYKR